MKISARRFVEYLENKNLKKRTLENYMYYFNRFVVFEQFTQESVSRFLSKKENRNSNAKGFLKNLKKYLLINYKELRITNEYKNSILEVEFPTITGRLKENIIKPIPHEEVLNLEKYLRSERLKIMLLFCYFCGLRLNELLTVTTLSFDWKEWGKNVEGMGECRVLGKGNKEGIALIPSFLMKRIANYIKRLADDYLRKQDYIFCWDPTNKKIRETGTVAREFQKSVRLAGIKSGITHIGDNNEPIRATCVFPHRLRHSYAHYLLNVKRLNIREVQELMRHSSITSTQIYTYIDKEALKNKLSNVIEI